MVLKLDGTDAAKRPSHVMSEQCAEYLSRIWQAVSFLEEAKSHLAKVRQSASRDTSASTLSDAVALLVFAADVMVPEAMRRRVLVVPEHPAAAEA